MYQNIKQIIEEILAETPPVISISLDEVAEKIGEKIKGDPPSKSTVKRFLNDMGIYAKRGKVRQWVYRHNPGKAE